MVDHDKTWLTIKKVVTMVDHGDHFGWVGKYTRILKQLTYCATVGTRHS